MARLRDSKAITLATLGLILLAGSYLILQIFPYLSQVIDFLESIAAPFLLALATSYLLHPVITFLHIKLKLPKVFAILLIYLLIAALVTLIFIFCIPKFIVQLEHLTTAAANLEQTLPAILAKEQSSLLPPKILAYIMQLIFYLKSRFSLANLNLSLDKSLNYLFILFVTPFLAFYMLRDSAAIEESLGTVCPTAHKSVATKIISEVNETLSRYIRGQLMVSIVIGSLTFLSYKFICGLPHSLLLASLAAICNFIPYLGPFLGAAPALVIAATLSWETTLAVFLTNLILQIFEGNLISPQIIGKQLALHPLLVIFAVIVGGEAAGIWGLLLAVPVLAILKIIIKNVMQETEENQANKI
ncbi:MAG: hypothetical protein RLZ12_493 [Bacillota bacterium]|jgi:predicted PurR-regulated permease PerM